ncbi:glycosyltransferase [Microbacterium amylolyticum]|uniref:Glycosyltransferase involved in cell wall biosynthesis n=1 Tax=Microbacterium amylolyticum TaxID=936337 RepID=A0ABS4ZM81_9MICO|nr:glycosyltransferase [Microbacterium amylolyticum]MBP2437566.1 glycosyltransferase involved in cell wall biosynthesis [Microbacterium amylolyticum]
MRSGHQVLVFPAYRDNPFLNLLQLSAVADGFTADRARNYEELILKARGLEPGDVFHLHWTNPILQQAPDAATARARLREFSALLDELRASEVGVVWTIHNRLPHELAFRDIEIDLSRLIAQKATRIHVMAPHTPEAVAEVMTLDPEKTVVIPHPSYEGIYETGITRADARQSFSLDDERAVLFLGQIRPYKGVDSLIRAIGDAAASLSDPQLALLLGGVVKEMPRDEFIASLPTEVKTTAHLEFVDDSDLARWFRAADVAVFPYRAILNSGSLHLAATFEVPVILPADPHLVTQFGDEAWVAFFDPENPRESIAELLADPHLFRDVTSASFAEFLSPITPWNIARQYRDLLSEISVAGRKRSLSA